MKTIATIAFCSLLFVPVYGFGQESPPAFPHPGSILPHSFSPLSLNRLELDKLYSAPDDNPNAPRPIARRRCLISTIGLRPLVLVFTRRTVDPKALTLLMAGLEKAIEKHHRDFLNGALVVIDKGVRRFEDVAPQSIPMPMNEKDFLTIADDLLKEEESRLTLKKWLTATLPNYWTDKFVMEGKEKKAIKVFDPAKKIYLAIHPEPDSRRLDPTAASLMVLGLLASPGNQGLTATMALNPSHLNDLGFLIDPNAEMTVILAYKHNVMGYQQFHKGGYTVDQAQDTLNRVEQMMLKLVK